MEFPNLKDMKVMELVMLRKELTESYRMTQDKTDLAMIQEIDKHLDRQDLCNFCGGHH